MRKIIVVVMVMLFVGSLSNIAFANCGACGMIEEGAEEQEGTIINDVCPVMGGKVNNDTPYKVVYKGETIGFCCPACIEKFNADPEKYMADLQEKSIIKCPECGAEIDVIEECKKGMMKGSCPMME